MQTDERWREDTLSCPFDGVPVEGYNMTLEIPRESDKDVTFWLDDVRFEPRWRD